MDTYIDVLPSSPVEFLRLYPSVARAVYSASNLPCACPLHKLAIANVKAKVQMRGGLARSCMPTVLSGNIAGGTQMQGLHAHA
jgi:hypothetical protein